jgi:hypothetical protein
MTRAEARKLYVGAGGPNDHQPSDWESIHREMESVVAAKSVRAAGRTIDWWGCWDRKYTATAFARRVRELHEQMRKDCRLNTTDL